MRRSWEAWSIKTIHVTDGGAVIEGFEEAFSAIDGTFQAPLFPTKQVALMAIKDVYGHLPNPNRRKSGWRMPKPVRVKVSVEAED